ncbi:hypothetical protein BH20VER3_BH20VER3_22730 [soil metagenome]
MTSRQFTLILLVALVLGTAGWFLFHRGERSWESEPVSDHDKVLNFQLNDVAHVTIKDATSELNLIRKADVWVVAERADYPANFEQVSRLLQKVWDMKPVETLQVGPSQFGRLQLIEPPEQKSGTLLDLKDKDNKRITALLVGKQYLKKTEQSVAPGGYPAGRYVMPEDGTKHVFLIGDPLQDLITKPERWISHDFLKIEKPKSIALDGKTPEMKWKIERTNESAPWQLADLKPSEETDQTKASALASTFGNMSFADVLAPDTKPDTIGLDQPSTITIEASHGLTYTLKIGQLKDEKYPVTVSLAAAPNEKPEEKKKQDEKLAQRKKLEGRPFLISKFTIDQLLKKRADLLKPPPSPSPTPTPTTPASAKTKPSRLTTRSGEVDPAG